MKPIALCLAALFALSSLQALSPEQAESIAQKIWKNESNQSIEGLICWNTGEEFASLGIGHFIWYPKKKRGPFKETFPALLQFLQENKVAVPQWLMTIAGCPWSSQREFLEKKNDPPAQELRQLLIKTIDLQAQFIAKRFDLTEKHLTDTLPLEQKKHISKQLERLKAAPNGTYALLDYLNFKGEGTSPQEQYRGHGWGLVHVLTLMPDTSSDPVKEFAAAAKAVLVRRVQNAPPEKNEQRWLEGWFRRIDTY